MKFCEEMKNIDIRTVDKSTLTDLKDIKINTNKPICDRLMDFIKQVNNPYCIIVDGIAVKMSFSDTSETMNDRIKTYFMNKAEWMRNEL